MCAACCEKIRREGGKKTKIVGNTRVEAYFVYEDEVQRLIRGLKYRNKRELAGDIAKILYEVAGKDAFPSGEAQLIPVPLHPARQAKRKYNQMELIAGELSLLTGCEVNTGLVKRVKETVPQYNLSPQARRKNLKGAFRAFPESYTGKQLILLDDISTTGATLEEMALELERHDIRNVRGLVIAFTGRKQS
jgi:ComF family protein